MNKVSNCAIIGMVLITGYANACGNERIDALERAFSPTTPQILTEVYAKAVKERNAAVQYMLFCPELKKKNLATYEEMNWVSGTSSPSYAKYQIQKTSEQQFNIKFYLTLQGQPAGTELTQLSIIKSPQNTSQHYCIKTIKISESRL